MSIFKKAGVFISGLALLTTLVACGNDENASKGNENKNSEIVAKVNGTEITRNQFDETLEQLYNSQGIDVGSLDESQQQQLQASVVDQLVNNELLLQSAENENITATDEEINTQIQSIKEQLGSDEEYQNALLANNLTEEKLKEDLSKEVAIQKYIKTNIGEVTVSEDEIQDFYDQYSEQHSADEEEVPELEQIKPQIEQTLIQDKQNQEVEKLLEKLRAENEIEVFI